MKVLVIPDIHLKPWIFERAENILQDNSEIQNSVVLGDIPDDFNQERNLDLYVDTFDKAIQFAKNHPESLWCYGNHDVCYPWSFRESGWSAFAVPIVNSKLHELEMVVGEHYKFVHKIDNVLFSHGGVCKGFVDNLCYRVEDYRNIDQVLERINKAPAYVLWKDNSPLWFRPQHYTGVKTYYPRKLFQVVGHTPVKAIDKSRNILSCDSFSTYPDGSPYGEQKFTIVDTEDWSFSTAV